MAYADKCFYFDWGDRKIRLEDFDIYDEITVRRRSLWDEETEISSNNVSIELWVKDDEREKHEDQEAVLSRDNAMKLAGKLLRAVAELDADGYLSDLQQDVELLKEAVGDKFDETKDEWSKYGALRDPKGGLFGALANYVQTPRGQDALKAKEEAENNDEQDN